MISEFWPGHSLKLPACCFAEVYLIPLFLFFLADTVKVLRIPRVSRLPHHLLCLHLLQSPGDKRPDFWRHFQRLTKAASGWHFHPKRGEELYGGIDEHSAREGGQWQYLRCSRRDVGSFLRIILMGDTQKYPFNCCYCVSPLAFPVYVTVSAEANAERPESFPALWRHFRNVNLFSFLPILSPFYSHAYEEQETLYCFSLNSIHFQSLHWG